MRRIPPAPRLLVVLLALWAAAPASARQAGDAQAELEAELAKLVDLPDPRLTVMLEGLEAHGYVLREAEFVLDGKKLPTPKVEALSGTGPRHVFEGALPSGDHTLLVRVTYEDVDAVFSRQAGYRWRLSSRASFRVERGLDVTVRAIPLHEPGQADVRDQFRLTAQVFARMTAEVPQAVAEAPAPAAPPVKVAEPTPPLPPPEKVPEPTPTPPAKAAAAPAPQEPLAAPTRVAEPTKAPVPAQVAEAPAKGKRAAKGKRSARNPQVAQKAAAAPDEAAALRAMQERLRKRLRDAAATAKVEDTTAEVEAPSPSRLLRHLRGGGDGAPDKAAQAPAP